MGQTGRRNRTYYWQIKVIAKAAQLRMKCLELGGNAVLAVDIDYA